MNMLTVADIYTDVSKYVNNGSCDEALILSRVSEACKRLMVKAAWAYTTQAVLIRTDRAMFPLPRECSAVLGVNICNQPAHVYPAAYEFLASGPGEIGSWRGSGMRDLVREAGVSPTMYDIPSIETIEDDAAKVTDRTFLSDGYRLVAFSPFAEDADKSIVVRGLDKYNTPMSGAAAGALMGETIRINRWHEGIEGSITTGNTWEDKAISTKPYRSILSWSKPVTRGHVSLYAVDTATDAIWLLAKAHPVDKIPRWARYRLTNFDKVNGDSAIIYALCKMAALDLTRQDDILPIQQASAVIQMVQCIQHEMNSDTQKANQMEANAVRLLAEQKSEQDGQGPTIGFIDHELEMRGWAFNRGPI